MRLFPQFIYPRSFSVVIELYQTHAERIEEYILRGTAYKSETLQLSRGGFHGINRFVLTHTHSLGIRSANQSILEIGTIPKGEVAMIVPMKRQEHLIDGRVLAATDIAVLKAGSSYTQLTLPGGRYLRIGLNVKRMSETLPESLFLPFNDRLQALLSPRKVNVETKQRLMNNLSSFLDDIFKDKLATTHTAELEEKIVSEIMQLEVLGEIVNRSNSRLKVLNESILCVHQLGSQDLTVAKLADAMNTTRRSIEYAFHRYIGLSPKEYITAIKLNRIRQDLQSGDSSSSVGEIAKRHGFNHLGRLSSAYRDMFNELPRVTQRIS